MTHKHEDLKLTAVRYYLDNDTTYAETCRIFNCSDWRNVSSVVYSFL